MTSWRYSVVCSNKASLNAPLKNLVWLADCFELLKPRYLTHIGMLRQCSCSPFALCKSHNKHGYSLEIKHSAKQKLQPNHVQKVVLMFLSKSSYIPKISCHQDRGSNLQLPGVSLSHLVRLKGKTWYICHINLEINDSKMANSSTQ